MRDYLRGAALSRIPEEICLRYDDKPPTSSDVVIFQPCVALGFNYNGLGAGIHLPVRRKTQGLKYFHYGKL